jgi:hypothetical protein
VINLLNKNIGKTIDTCLISIMILVVYVLINSIFEIPILHEINMFSHDIVGFLDMNFYIILASLIITIVIIFLGLYNALKKK